MILVGGPAALAAPAFGNVGGDGDDRATHLSCQVELDPAACSSCPQSRGLRSDSVDASQEATPRVLPPKLRIVEPDPKERYVTCVPLVPLKAAAGAFSDPQHVEAEGFEWVAVETRHRLRPGMFVAQVVGKSMEPTIPDGAYCLFRAPVEGTRQGKTVLVQLRETSDPETSQRYTVKRYESEKANDGDSWHHTKITLKPVNPAFDSIVLSGADEQQLQVVAELIEVMTNET